MRILLVVALWLAATLAATGLAFGAVAIVGDAASAPPVVLAPIDVPGDGPVEIVAEDGALAVECEADAITLVWAQPAGGSTVAIRESGPSAVVVEFAEEDDEVTRVEVVCVDGEPTWTTGERDADEGPVTTSTTSTTEADDDDDDRPTSTTTSPPTTGTTEPDRSTTTSTTEADDDDDDDDDVTTTTEADDDDPDDDD